MSMSVRNRKIIIEKYNLEQEALNNKQNNNNHGLNDGISINSYAKLEQEKLKNSH